MNILFLLFIFNISLVEPINNVKVINYSGFTVGYNQRYNQASWVAYSLDKTKLVKLYKRVGSFRADNRLNKPITKKSYLNSGYDLGHLFPANDASYSYNSMYDCFFMTNISPQLPTFNRGIWKTLEFKVRNWSDNFDTLYIITGGILNDSLESFGEDNIVVPKYFYKIIFCKLDSSSIGFLFNQRNLNNNLKNYVVSVDSIENITKINFFPFLNNYKENFVDFNKWF